jgi:hypothetical protein
MGMGRAFSNYADFSGISDIPLKISKVLQKAYIDVNEKGTEAAAVAVVSMKYRSFEPRPQKVTFKADRPFLFAVTGNSTGTVLFMGKAGNPAGDKQNRAIQIVAKRRSCVVIWKNTLYFSRLPAVPSRRLRCFQQREQGTGQFIPPARRPSPVIANPMGEAIHARTLDCFTHRFRNDGGDKVCFATALLFACNVEKQNILRGKTDGLDAGDGMILSATGGTGDRRYIKMNGGLYDHPGMPGQIIPPARRARHCDRSEAIQCTRMDCFTHRFRNDGGDSLTCIRQNILLMTKEPF